ncbi:hypothetical protein LDENG_00113510 [Lucifuga dentata]|nr:hypothetical protein LDENG_00113510 [Lucifuga dentata]
MRTHWWSVVLGFLCMSAEAAVITWTVSQTPSIVSLMRVNMSAEITCSTSLTDPSGLYLKSRFRGDRDNAYLFLQNRQIAKNTISGEFVGRIQVSPDLLGGRGYAVTFQLSLLRLEDTDMYYCSWKYFNMDTTKPETLSSNGTIIIIRDRAPQEECRGRDLDLIFVVLSVMAFMVIMFLFIGALLLRCARFKRQFRPERATPKLSRHRHVCPQQQFSHQPAPTLDYRGIL